MSESKRKQRFTAILIIILIIAISFFRDHVFKSINEQLRLYYYNLENYRYSFLEPIISKFDSDGLTNLKFILTLFFCVIFTFLTTWLIWKLFRNKAYVKTVLITYSSIFLLAFLIYLAGRIANYSEAGYELSRNISEFLQSPLLVLILVAVFKFDSRTKAVII